MAKKMEAGPVPPSIDVVPLTGTATAVVRHDSEDLFKLVRETLSQRHKNRELLLSVPIWGWTGDGKTVSLLTAHYFLDVFEHGLGLALVTNTSALLSMEAESETYRGLNLVATAEATKERIAPLIERFVEGGEWPPGTDEGIPYLFDLRTVLGTVGYLFMPDLRGGSYREVDAQAREVLRAAHATVVLVRPDQFAAQTAEGKRYRDAVIGQIQEAAAARLPTAVLITQADKFPNTGSAADDTHRRLTVLLEQHRDFPNCIARVSVVGKSLDDPSRLPPAGERDPSSLLRPIVWLLWQALLRPREDIHASVPALSLHPTSIPETQKTRVSVPELRISGEHSNAPGIAVASTLIESRSTAFLFLTEDGELVETSIALNATSEPRSSKAGQLTEFDENPSTIDAYLSSGTLTLGLRSGADWIWHGTKGTVLQRTSLPTTLSTWVSISPGLLVGIDTSNSGRLGSFRLSSGKWQMVDHIGGFIPQTTLTFIGYLPQRSLVIAMNGERVEAVTLRGDGTFGDRVGAPLSLRFDTQAVRLSSAGVAAAVLSSGQLSIATADKPLTLPSIAKDAQASFALATAAPVVAAVLADKRLVAARVTPTALLQTQPVYSPALSETPTSLCWSPNGLILVATFGGGRWTSYRPFGLGV